MTTSQSASMADLAVPASFDPSAGPPEPVPGLPVANLLVISALAAAVFAQGGFYRTGQRMVLLLLAGAAIMTVFGKGRSSLVRGPLARASAAMAGWSLVVAALAGDWTAACSTVLILAGALVVAMTCERLDTDQREQLVLAVVGLGVLVALSGWVGVAWRMPPWGLPDQGLWRAATTLSYANAAAGLLAALALLSLGRAAAGPRSTPMAVANVVLLTGLGATLSRGGFVAFLAGGLVLARVLGIGVLLRRAAAPVLGATVALAGLWPSIPVTAPARPALAATGLLLGVAVAVGAARLSLRPLAAVAAAAIVVLTLTLVAWSPTGDASRHIARPRFSMASPDRIDEARAALRVAASAPLTGVGPGKAELRWVRADGAVAIAHYAHNEYLQVLAELGALGLGLLVALVMVIARMLRRCRATPSLPVWAGAAAGLTALGVHGLFDFGWHLPAVPLTGALLVGIVTTTNNRKDQK